MTNPTLERAARAVAVACEQVRPSDEHDAEAWTFIARAVLMAVREPDVVVCHHVSRAAWHSGSGRTPDSVWQAGIDALLSEDQ